MQINLREQGGGREMKNLKKLVNDYEEAAEDNNSTNVRSLRMAISGGDKCEAERIAVNNAVTAIRAEIRRLRTITKQKIAMRHKIMAICGDKYRFAGDYCEWLFDEL